MYTVHVGDTQHSTRARVPAVLTGLDALLEANAGRELDTASDVKPARTAGMLIVLSLACTAAAAGATLHGTLGEVKQAVLQAIDMVAGED